MANTNTNALLQRLHEMEEKLAHQEKMTAELSDQLAEQWKANEIMSRKLNALTERFLALEEAATPMPEATKPPHW